eukprot:TRINITY_DN2948_c0_g1_i1.p1 TRINITY_DN2948_c0_g1~~TRINITY_DN2948_c0_g1_i1.p1  ORF type:complete len:213 (+),score=48.20 TRINITY_DN2948_c0_g1_i1:70-708(+)
MSTIQADTWNKGPVYMWDPGVSRSPPHEWKSSMQNESSYVDAQSTTMQNVYQNKDQFNDAWLAKKCYQEATIQSKPSNRSMNTRKATRCRGKHCNVQKHSSLGCAVVTLPTKGIRELLLQFMLRNIRAYDGATVFDIDGIEATIKPHIDKVTSADVETDVFVGWGRQTDLATPVAPEKIAKAIDEHVELALKCFEMHESSPPPQDMPKPSFQ